MNKETTKRKPVRKRDSWRVAKLKLQLQQCIEAARAETILYATIHGRTAELTRLRESIEASRRTVMVLKTQHEELMKTDACPTCNRVGSEWQQIISERHEQSVKCMIEGVAEDSESVGKLEASLISLREQLKQVEGAGVRKIELETEIRLLNG